MAQKSIGAGLQIGRIRGIPIYLHASWIFIFALITYDLKTQFAREKPEWTSAELWALGTVTSLLFFGSVLFHELSHSVIAQHYKIRVVSITLFLFGGLARIGRDPAKPIQEFNIAVAGPIASFFLCGVFYLLGMLFPQSEMFVAVANLLGSANLMLGGFNLLPGFPLDGGRIFRAIVWGITKDHTRATKMAGAAGKMVAYVLIGGGVAYAIAISKWEAAVWPVLLGWFLLNAAQESVAQLAIRESLAGLRASDVMSSDIPTLGPEFSLEDYGTEVLRTGRRNHLVITHDRLVGMMNVHMLNSVPRHEWAHTSVQAAMIPRKDILWTTPDEPLLRLLERLLAADINQMPVVTGGNDDENSAQIVGIITRDSILRVMQTRSEVGPITQER